jgi:hypothetical protein
VARDAISRVENVDTKSIRIDREKSTLTFGPAPGKSLDLSAIHAALKKTRLGKNAGSQLTYFQLTAVGQVTGEQELRLKVKGTGQEFVLAEVPQSDKGGVEGTALQHLRKELAKKPGEVEITGHVEGWKGRFPEVLKREMPGVPVLLVTDFRLLK